MIGFYDGLGICMDLKRKTEEKLLGHTKNLTAVCLSFNNLLAATGSLDKKIYV